MPEVAEVAHACALLRRNVLGLTVRRASLPLDELLFPVLKNAQNAGENIPSAEKHVSGATVKSVGRHGKYFWLRFETSAGLPLVMLMHFGMTGRIRMRNVHSHMIFMENGGDQKVLKAKAVEESGSDGHNEAATITVKSGNSEQKNDTESTGENGSGIVSEDDVWPPKFTKFELTLAGNSSAENSADLDEHLVELAFSDPRRLARVRFLHGEKYASDVELMKVPPLKSLGPDYSKKGHPTKESRDHLGDRLDNVEFSGDPDPCHHGRPRLTFDEFASLVLTKKKPIKAFLLDQDFFAGIGNWVSDEILYHARIHPGEILSKKIVSHTHPSLQKLYDSIIYIMEESVRVEGNAKLFPEDWLMLHRWGKGRKQPRATTKSGHKVDFETIGGRTSCFVPELQKTLKREVEEGVKTEEDPSQRKSPYFPGSSGLGVKPLKREKEDKIETEERKRGGKKRGTSEQTSVKEEVEAGAGQDAQRRKSARLSAFAYVEDT